MNRLSSLERIMSIMLVQKSNGKHCYRLSQYCGCQAVRDTDRAFVINNEGNVLHLCFSEHHPCCACVYVSFTELLEQVPKFDVHFTTLPAGKDERTAISSLQLAHARLQEQTKKKRRVVKKATKPRIPTPDYRPSPTPLYNTPNTSEDE